MIGDGLAASRRWYFAASLIVLLLDQATKVAAHAWLRGTAPVPVIPGFLSLTYSRNPGGLFGYFRDWPEPARMFLLTLLPVVAIALIASFLLRSRGVDRPTLAGLALILGGATGNLIDRIVRGEVVDFIDAYLSGSPGRTLLGWFGTAHWPTFNVADSSIVCGAGLLLLSVLRPPDSAPRARPGPSAPPAGN